MKPTDVFIVPKEKPAVWFSSRQMWEPTATKLVVKNGLARIATMEEMQQLAGGLVRFGVQPDTPGIIGWYEFKRVSGVSSRIARSLESTGYAQGANPNEWYASFEPVFRPQWAAIQVCENGTWVNVPLD